jgi:hypothetical protein
MSALRSVPSAAFNLVFYQNLMYNISVLHVESQSTNFVFQERAWLTPPEAQPVVLEGRGSKSRPRRAPRSHSWSPGPEAWRQFVTVHRFVGLHVSIRFWDDATMWLLAEDDWPRRVVGRFESAVTMLDGIYLQAYLALRQPLECGEGGSSGLSYMRQGAEPYLMLAPLSDIYQVARCSPRSTRGFCATDCTEDDGLSRTASDSTRGQR